MATLLRELRIELVLTAHPTEAKRRTVLSKLQRISDVLRRLQDPDLLPRERTELLARLQAEITALWLTDRARTTRPAVTDEVRTGLYFVDESSGISCPASPPISRRRSRATTPACSRRPRGSRWHRGSAAIATAIPPW